ncbi:MAG: glycosyltransferase family 2 protein [Myxococcota bacterium]
MRVAALIPALNEERSVGDAVRRLRMAGVPRVVVVDNGSTDQTTEVARAAGAQVVREERRGYGRACLAGMAHLQADPPDALLFMDADLSDVPEEAALLLSPLSRDHADLVIGSRVLGEAEGRAERGSLTPPQRFGNALSCWLLWHLYGVPATDLGPFRAIRWDALMRLGLTDQDFGWNVEMQIKAARQRLRVMEVAVSYRTRKTGTSKISGDIRGTVKAGTKILYTVARLRGSPVGHAAGGVGEQPWRR